MAAFPSYHHQQQEHPFNLDSSLFLPNNPSTMFDQIIINPMSMFDQNLVDQVSFNNKNSTTTSSVVTDHKYHDDDDDDDMAPKVLNNMDKKRKSKHPSPHNSCAQSKEKKRKKQKKMIGDVAGDEGKKEAPTGYIHVRARRGQATDSHSLAERVRREKISERMKLLQSLVPGCEKVSGKALMLDEIINYVQSLQNQVEFLSMKLASVNPSYYDFGMDLEPFMVSPQDDDRVRARDQGALQDLRNLTSPVAALGSMQMQACSPTADDIHHHLLDTYFMYAHPQGQGQGSNNSLFSFH